MLSLEWCYLSNPELRVALSIHNNETNDCTMIAYVKWYMCKEQCQPWSDAIEAIQGSE